MNEDLVAVAKVTKSRGLRGELVADVLTDFPERFDELEDVIALLPNGKRLDLQIERFWFQKERIIFKFAKFDTLEISETLRGAEICIPEAEAVKLESDAYFDWQLENCQVETIEGEKLGFVKEILRTGGTEILVVQGSEKDYLIPFAEAICPKVDIENKLIKVDAPEGLLDF